MLDFYCNKRFDISFSDFHKLIKIILPSDYTSIETRGIYKIDYMPCNIIQLKQEDTVIANIYCWLGQKGLTVLANNPFAVSLCIEALKEVKQNPEDYRVLSSEMINELETINELSEDKSLLIYKQLNSSEKTSKYIIKEYNGDEVLLEFYYDPDTVRLSGAVTSLFTLVQLRIETKIKQSH